MELELDASIVTVIDACPKGCGGPVGNVLVRVRMSKPRTVFLYRLYVEPAYRRKGVGRALIAGVIKDYQGYTIELDAAPFADQPMSAAELVAFYESMGFVRCPELGEYAMCVYPADPGDDEEEEDDEITNDVCAADGHLSVVSDLFDGADGSCGNTLVRGDDVGDFHRGGGSGGGSDRDKELSAAVDPEVQDESRKIRVAGGAGDSVTVHSAADQRRTSTSGRSADEGGGGEQGIPLADDADSVGHSPGSIGDHNVRKLYDPSKLHAQFLTEFRRKTVDSDRGIIPRSAIEGRTKRFHVKQLCRHVNTILVDARDAADAVKLVLSSDQGEVVGSYDLRSFDARPTIDTKMGEYLSETLMDRGLELASQLLIPSIIEVTEV